MCEIHKFCNVDCGLFSCIEMCDSKYKQESSKCNISELNVQL